MLKLYGFALSNYFNMVKMALLEKGIDYEFVEVKPSQEPDYLSKSPMGKVPVLETSDGFISETSVIFEYLEDLGKGQALLPADPYQRAKTRELTKEIELYIELVARTCYKEVFFGGSVSDEVKQNAKEKLLKGLAAMKRNGKFAPYLMGEQFTYADIMFMYTVSLAASCTKRAMGFSLFDEVPEAKTLLKTIAERDSAKIIAADQKQAS